MASSSKAADALKTISETMVNEQKHTTPAARKQTDLPEEETATSVLAAFSGSMTDPVDDQRKNSKKDRIEKTEELKEIFLSSRPAGSDLDEETVVFKSGTANRDSRGLEPDEEPEETPEVLELEKVGVICEYAHHSTCSSGKTVPATSRIFKVAVKGLNKKPEGK